MFLTLLLTILAQPSAPDFAREVRPILARACFKCHGPDEPARKGKLRLDDAVAARAGGRSGQPAVTPGKPQESLLLDRLDAEGTAHMPPSGTGIVLSDREKAVLRAWVVSGAEYRQHCAFITPTKPALPAVRDMTWCRNSLDRFILARLEAEGLKPPPEADRVTLLRRPHPDLTGLPPTPADVDPFLPVPATDSLAPAVSGLSPIPL